jgi:hypothetical protein
MHRETNLIIVQRNVTLFSLLYFCRQLYMFRVLKPIIRSSYNCNYSFWHWSTAMNNLKCVIPEVFYNNYIRYAHNSIN